VVLQLRRGSRSELDEFTDPDRESGGRETAGQRRSLARSLLESSMRLAAPTIGETAPAERILYCDVSDVHGLAVEAVPEVLALTGPASTAVTMSVATRAGIAEE